MNRWSKGLIIAGIGTIGLAAGAFAKEMKRGKWDVAKIEGSIVYFKNGEKLNTDLYEIKFLGQLPLSTQSPVLIFSGTDCKDCCAPNAIFFFTPAEKNKKVEPSYAPYDYPGREYSSEDSTLMYESRMFYGKVLPNVDNGVIWYQTMMTEEGTYQKSVYIVKIVNNRLEEAFLLDHLPEVSTTLKFVEENRCTEVKGIDYTVEP